MNRKLKPSILAFLAALAVSAAVAQAASAESFIFRADAAEMELTGAQHGAGDVFTTSAGTVECSSITYTGTSTSDEMETVELAPTYSGCTALGLAETQVNANGCQYRLNPKTVEGSSFEGDMDIVCPGGNVITATAKVGGITACIVHIPPQEGLGSVTYTNVSAGPEELTVALNLSGISYSFTSGLGCESGSAEDGTYEGAGLLEGEGEGEAAALVVDYVGTHMSILPKPMVFNNTEKIGAETTFTVENGHAIERRVKSVQIVDSNNNKEETFFKIVKDTCTEKKDLIREAECKVTVSLATEVTKTRWLRFVYGGWWLFAAQHTLKRDIAKE